MAGCEVAWAVGPPKPPKDEATLVDADVVRSLVQKNRVETLQLYTLALMRQCATVEDWPVVVDNVMEALLNWQHADAALAMLARVRAVYTTARPEVAANELAWLLDILYTLELVARVCKGEAIGPYLDRQAVTLNVERVARTAREYGQPQVPCGLWLAPSVLA